MKSVFYFIGFILLFVGLYLSSTGHFYSNYHVKVLVDNLLWKILIAPAEYADFFTPTETNDVSQHIWKILPFLLGILLGSIGSILFFSGMFFDGFVLCIFSSGVGWIFFHNDLGNAAALAMPIIPIELLIILLIVTAGVAGYVAEALLGSVFSIFKK